MKYDASIKKRTLICAARRNNKSHQKNNFKRNMERIPANGCSELSPAFIPASTIEVVNETVQIGQCIECLLFRELASLAQHVESMSADVQSEFSRIVHCLETGELIKDGSEKQLKVASEYGDVIFIELLVHGIACLESRIGSYEFRNCCKTIFELKERIQINLPIWENAPKLNDAATVFQKNIRTYNIIGVDHKPEPFGEVAAWRIKGEVMGFKIDPEASFPWVKLPAACEINGRKGGFKTLTHENARHVGLTIKNQELFETAHPAVVEAVVLHNLYTIVLQKRVNSTYLIARNLGPNLRELVANNAYVFNYVDFVMLASHIDKLHSLDMVHRDIKLDNLFLYKGCICIGDNDSAGKVGSFNKYLWTRAYLPVSFLEYYSNKKMKATETENAGRDSPFSIYKRDQFAFLRSMMRLYFWPQSLSHCNEEQIDQFISVFPCGAELKKELKNFTCEPESYSLTSLARYLTSE